MEENKPAEVFEERSDFREVREVLQKVKEEVGKIIVGQEEMVELLLASLLAGGHVLIEGNPGVAKTLTAKILAKTIDSNFQRIQFTPDLMPSDVIGTSIFNFKTSEFEFKRGPIFSNIILIDEINRSPAKTQAALFEAMEERQVSVDGNTYLMDDPFMIIATQNPIDMEGTYRLPEAQMDRFFFKIKVDYPSMSEEIKIIKAHHINNRLLSLDSINAMLPESKLLLYRQKLDDIVVEEKLMSYIAEIVQKTRSFADIYIGASPRASIALLTGSKALALLRGRDFVIPEDIIELAVPVLEHRITIVPEREMEGVPTAKIIKALIKGIEIPR